MSVLAEGLMKAVYRKLDDSGYEVVDRPLVIVESEDSEGPRAFFRSSGTSANAYTFPGVYIEFFGIVPVHGKEGALEEWSDGKVVDELAKSGCEWMWSHFYVKKFGGFRGKYPVWLTEWIQRAGIREKTERTRAIELLDRFLDKATAVLSARINPEPWPRALLEVIDHSPLSGGARSPRILYSPIAINEWLERNDIWMPEKRREWEDLPRVKKILQTYEKDCTAYLYERRRSRRK